MTTQQEQQESKGTLQVTQRAARQILTPQRQGFLANGPYPFTHALQAYTGCGFGQTTCGLYCYAQFLPNWSVNANGAGWGQAIQVKSNAAELLGRELARMQPQIRHGVRIFMSSATDPYQPIEHTYKVTQHCLEVFTRYPELDLLVVQTRSPLAERDLSLLTRIPYAWLSVTIETDDQAYLKSLKGGPGLERRWKLVQAASESGIPTQITVSPCLRYSDVAAFGHRLLQSGAQRIIVDTTVDGDGTHGKRTSHSPFALTEPAWSETTQAHQLYAYLKEHADQQGIALGWSNAGFCGIAPRKRNSSA